MKKLILCHVFYGREVRRRKGKWKVTKQEFPDDVYPDYCEGSAVLYSQVQKF
jgi:hypothetical protein